MMAWVPPEDQPTRGKRAQVPDRKLPFEKPAELIGRTCRIVGYDTDPHLDSLHPWVAHVCLDVQNGPRVFFEATPNGGIRIVQEPR